MYSDVLLEGQCVEPKRSNAIPVIKHFGFMADYLLTREVWTYCLSSRTRIALLVTNVKIL